MLGSSLFVLVDRGSGGPRNTVSDLANPGHCGLRISVGGRQNSINRWPVAETGDQLRVTSRSVSQSGELPVVQSFSRSGRAVAQSVSQEGVQSLSQSVRRAVSRSGGRTWTSSRLTTEEPSR